MRWISPPLSRGGRENWNPPLCGRITTMSTSHRHRASLNGLAPDYSFAKKGNNDLIQSAVPKNSCSISLNILGTKDPHLWINFPPAIYRPSYVIWLRLLSSTGFEDLWWTKHGLNWRKTCPFTWHREILLNVSEEFFEDKKSTWIYLSSGWQTIIETVRPEEENACLYKSRSFAEKIQNAITHDLWQE